MKRPFDTFKGFALVEVLVASAIILLFISALSGAYSLYIRTAFSNLRKVQAALLSEEGIEVVKTLRDSSWATNIAPLSSSTPYHITFSSGAWKATTTKIYVDGIFDRTFTVGDVYRDSLSDITSSGGTYDPNTRVVTVSVAWQNHGATTTKSIATYIANLFVN
jgi:prepilin-type N-terminal cleavage/methylation domain-containing protein